MKNENKTSIRPLKHEPVSPKLLKKKSINGSTCGCKSKISKEFKDLPVIPAKRLQDINVGMNATSKSAIQKSSGSFIPPTEKDVLSEPQQTQTAFDDISLREQKSFNRQFMDFIKKIINKIRNSIQSGSI